MDWLSHPLVLTSYAAVLGLVISFAKRLTKLFMRVTSVEQTVKSTEAKVDKLTENVGALSDDLHEHMAEEGRSMAKLQGMLSVLMRRENVHDGA